MNAMFALFDLGGTQIILILALILIFFGARRIPELAKGLGQGIREFKKATREVTNEIHNSVEDKNPPASQPGDQMKQASESPQAEKTASVPPSTGQKV